MKEDEFLNGKLIQATEATLEYLSHAFLRTMI